MFYDFIYLAKGFRMRPKGTINLNNLLTAQVHVFRKHAYQSVDTNSCRGLNTFYCAQIILTIHEIMELIP